jgi:hypothetical protein
MAKKEIVPPGTVSVRKAAQMLGRGESTLVREGNKIQPPIKTIDGYILISELPRLEAGIEEVLSKRSNSHTSSE